MRYILALLSLLILAGCGGNKRGGDLSDYNIRFDAPGSSPRTEQIPVPTGLPVGPAVDYYGKLKDEIRAETNNEIRNSVQHSSDQLSGLVTAKVGQLAEKVTGVELNLRELLRVEANVSATAHAELRAKVEASIHSVIELKNDVKAVATLTAQVNLQNTMMNDMKLQLKDLQAQLSATASAQIGLSNSLTHMQAGGDNNALTPEAVKLVLGITGGLFALLTTVICLVVRSSYKASMLREQNRTKEAQMERKQSNALLLELMSGDKPADFRQRVRSMGMIPPDPSTA